MPDVALAQTSRILGRGLITAETIYQEVRELLVRELSKHYDLGSWAEILAAARAILEEHEPAFAELFGEVDLAAWIAGYHWASAKLPPNWFELTRTIIDEGPPWKPPRRTLILPYGGDEEPIIRFPLIEKAAESLADRGILSRPEFDAASEDAKLRSFTVAGEHTTDTLQRIRDTLADVTREGASLDDFRELLEERIDTSPIGPAHLETVYRTNVQAAFRDGRETLVSNPVVSEMFPYQEYIPIHDGRVREEHLALEKLGLDETGIYRREDPFWNWFTPPWSYNCRCGVNLLTIEAAARKGVREAQEWLETGQKPPLRSRLPHIPFNPEPGFGSRGRVLEPV